MPECSQCHAPLPEDAPLGVCPACLLEGGTRREDSREEVELGFLDESSRSEALGVFDGYEVLEVLGQGASGIVLKAQDPSLLRTVAIKVLHSVLSTSGVSRKRFLGEARAAAAVSHDHVVTIHAVSEWKGLPYLVMECIAGKTLEDRIRSDGPLELKEILRIGRQIAAGLGAAHAQGLVHRDIKPANVLLENSVERVKLTDFGLARAHDEPGVTLTGFVAGTPEYMAPEQAEGSRVDTRSDLYGLGAVVYAMGTGRPPFQGKSNSAVLGAVARSEIVSLRTRNGELPGWLDEMVMRLLAKNPAERPESAREVEEWFAERLAIVQSDGPSAAGTIAGKSGRGRMRWMAAAAGIIILGILALLLRPDSGSSGEGSGKNGDPYEVYTRELFEALCRHAMEDADPLGTKSARDIDELLAASSEVVWLGRTDSPGPHNLYLKDIDDAPRLENLPVGSEVTWVIFIKNPDVEPRTGRVFPVQGMVRKGREDRQQDHATWILVLKTSAGRDPLPAGTPRKGCEIWAIGTPDAEN